MNTQTNDAKSVSFLDTYIGVGTVMFRDVVGKCPVRPETHKLVMVLGILSIPKDTTIQSDAIHLTLLTPMQEAQNSFGLIFSTDPSLYTKLPEQYTHCNPNSLLTSPIWKV